MTTKTLLLAASYLVGPLALAAAVRVAAAPPQQTVRLEVVPANVRLDGPAATQRLLVTAVSPNGARRDVTDTAVFRTTSPKVARLAASGEIAPGGSDGQAVVVASWNGRSARVPVSVTGAKTPFAPSFAGDVVPVLSRLGCSSGACHGAQQGKGGFRLSLRGYAPELDWIRITRELGGRRISREAPERSLFLKKPLMEVAHAGGKRLDKNSREHRILLSWLQQGTPGPTGKEPTLAKLIVLPGDRDSLKAGDKQRLLVRAVYSDGRAEDVTNRALFSSNDVAVATVDETGLVTQQRAGETAVVVKYRDKVAVARFVAPFVQAVNPAAFTARANFVDDAVNAKLRQIHVEPSGLCTDSEFLRRAYIDAIGTLPTAGEARAFLDDRDPDKRAKLVDALLQRPEFGLVWALKMGDLFVLRKEYLGRKNAMQFQAWLAEQFNANRPWDKIASDILTATGDPDENRAAFYFVSRAPQKDGEKYWIRKTENTAEMTAQVFLGSRIACARCHNHPTEKTTQDDYYHFVALWQQVTGKGMREGSIPERVEGTGNGEVRQPRTNELMEARPLDRMRLGFAKNEDRRVKTVRWMVKQPAFAQNIVNRVWARCFGQGIVEPVDDIRSTNPPKNQALMDALCRDFVARGYDLKHLMTTIMKSRTYQLSAVPNKTNRIDTRNFSHYPARRLPAEELVDALAQVTGVPDKFQNMALGARAIELADAEIPSLMLDTFGRPPRVQPSDTERACSPAVSQALALLNSEAVQQKLKSPDNVLVPLLKSESNDARVLETLFLSALARRPTPGENKTLLAAVKKAPSREEAFQDLLWALVNSKDFQFAY